MAKKIIITSIFILLIESIFFFWAYTNYIDEENKYLQTKTDELELRYTKIFDMYSVSANLVCGAINTKENILQIFSQAKDVDSMRRVALRKELYLELLPYYQYMQKSNYRQLHFHLPDNRSFLRFHRPRKYGDDLTKIRSTVRFANETQKIAKGFEEGRIFNGFRYVFPLSYNNEHIGTVETSVSFKAIIAQIEEHSNVICDFMINKKIVSQKVFDSEQQNYQNSLLNNFFYNEKKDYLKIKSKKIKDNITVLDIEKELSKDSEIVERLTNYDKFSVVVNYQKNKIIASFYPIRNFDNENVAYVMNYQCGAYAYDIQSSFILILLIGSSIIIFIIVFFIFMFYSRKTALLQNSKIKEQQQVIRLASNSLEERNRTLAQKNKKYSALNEEYRIQNVELLAAKEKAEESDRLKSAFLANMSHEIRTPMNAIIGFTEILKTTFVSAEKQDHFLQIIHNSGKHLINLINDIIDIAKIDANQLSVIETECQLNLFLDEIYQFFESVLIEKNKKKIQLKLHKTLGDKQSAILTDTTRLRQILTNLLGNAVKFTHSGSIEFGYSIENSLIQFYVKDTGIGIPKKDISIVFDRFRQADERDTRKYGGTGLGLAISKACVDLLGGNIWLNSELSKGSTFYFTIKYRPIPEFKAKEKIINQLHFNDLFENKTILIVEDDKYSFDILNLYLTPTNPNIIWVENGQEAIDTCKNKNIDLVLMDVNLPLVSGLKATEAILKLKPSLPIIMQTANAMQEDKSKALDAGSVDYLSKPINSIELISKIAKHIF